MSARTSDSVLIGLDAGTSVIKAVAFDGDGSQIGMASRRNTYNSLPDGGAEQDMTRTFEDAAAVLKALADEVPGLARRAVGLGITGQGDGTWLIDEGGAPVHDGWLWLDARAADEARAIATGPGHRLIYETTATGVNISQMRCQLRHMIRHMPDLVAKARTAFHCKDWIYYRLTGVLATDPTEGVFTFGDCRTRAYSDEVIEALGLADHRHLMPPIVDGAVTAHGLTRDAADATGLPEDLPVSLGYVDIMCTALGAGLHDRAANPGLTVLGSTGMHMRFVPSADDIVLNDDASGYTMAFPDAAYAQMQTNMAATINIDWVLGVACEILASQGVSRTRADLLDGLDDHVLAARPGAALYHPYILQAGERGPFAEPAARASFTGLDQTAGWFDLVRAVFDGLVLAGRDCYQAMGAIPDEIRISGGAARSGALKRLLAAALNRPVRGVAREEAGAAGAAMIAAVQLGHFADTDTASAAWVTPLLRDPVLPDTGLVSTYDHLFEGYLATRQALPPIWQAQAAMREALS